MLLINSNLVVTAQNNPIFWGQDFYVEYEVYAPTEVKLNENFTVTFLIRPKYNVTVDLITVTIYGNMQSDGNWDQWEYNWQNITMFADVEYTITKAFNVSSIRFGREGHLYVLILANYYFQGQAELYDAGSFQITRIGQGSYNELVDSYNEYMETHYHTNREYGILKLDYDLLQSQSNTDSGSSQYLIYLLLATTVLFVATTIYFARRKPKTD